MGPHARYQSLIVTERTLQVDPHTGGLFVIDRPFREVNTGGLFVIDRPFREVNIARTNRSPMDTLRWAMGSLPDETSEY